MNSAEIHTLREPEWSALLRQYRSHLLDISPSFDHLRRQLRQKWRNGLNRAEKESLTVSDSTGIEIYDTFYAIFREMQRRTQLSDIPIDPGALRRRLMQRMKC